MVDQTTIKQINKVIGEYFEKNTSVSIAPVKDLMPEFIAAGIFSKDVKKGMPIRKILRELDKTDQLQQIPFVHAERKDQDVYWYFVAPNTEIPEDYFKNDKKENTTVQEGPSYLERDESYIVDLCDKVLERKANRTKRFDFLFGDYHKDGKSRTKLPVDAYYGALNLVIEVVNEKPRNWKPTSKKEADREAQRKVYDQRRAELIPKNGVDLVIFSNSDFSCDADNKIIRNEELNLQIVRKRLKEYMG